MATKTRQPPVQPPAQGGAPPETPSDLPGFDTDEGPMRSELRRQIAELEGQLAGIVAQSCPWEPRQVNAPRGPAVQSGANLEQIRDELLKELHSLCRRIEGAVEAPSEEPRSEDPPPAAVADSADAGGRGVWRKLTKR